MGKQLPTTLYQLSQEYVMGFETQDVERMDGRGLTRLVGRDGRLVTEAGIETENHAMSTVVEYQSLIKFEELT